MWDTGDSDGHVMFLLNSLTVGGSEKKTVRVANALADSGMKITLAYLNGPHTLREEVAEGVDVLFLDRKGKFGMGALRRLIIYISRNKICVLCSINLYPLIYGYLCRLFHWSSGIRLLATTNTTLFITRKEQRKMWLYAPMLRRVDKIIFGSVYQRDLWIDNYKLDTSNCEFIYNGVDINLFKKSTSTEELRDIRAELAISQSDLVVGSVGRLVKDKNYELVVRACVALKQNMATNVYCLLLGEGDQRQRLIDLTLELECDEYVHILDAEHDVRPYLAAMDIFVLSSDTETFSNAALEAMAMGLPTVLPAVGGCPEMVEAGVTGFIYPPRDLPRFVEHLIYLGVDRDSRVKMGEEARRLVEESFQFESMVASYKRLLTQRKSAL